MIKFCQHMGWGMLAAVLEHMADRLRAGARADLLDLARITYVKSHTARALWENGWRSVRSVAEAEAGQLVSVLMLVRLPPDVRRKRVLSREMGCAAEGMADEGCSIGTTEKAAHRA